MFITYYDESGDDGFPDYSSEYFILTAVYFHHKKWKENMVSFNNFRTKLEIEDNFPIYFELHTSDFIKGKNPYYGRFTDDQRKQILFKFFDHIASLDIKIINVAICKNRITILPYDVLQKAFEYSIQRIENDMIFSFSNDYFLAITDEGRVQKMVKIARKLRNDVFENPSGGSSKIKYLIEDPLPKKSSDSHFIQVSDAVSYIISLYAKRHLIDTPIDWARRVSNVLNYGEEIELLNKIKKVLNTKACKRNEYGIVTHPY